MMEIIDTGLEFNSNYSSMKTIEGIVLHHSGVTVLQSVKTIHTYHKNKGWARNRIPLLCKKRWLNI